LSTTKRSAHSSAKKKQATTKAKPAAAKPAARARAKVAKAPAPEPERERPPVSTQQILHPERYFAATVPAQPALPEPPRERGYKSLVGGMLGELDFAILLEQFGGKQLAVDLAPHWRGSQFELRENRREQRVILLYAVEWDDEAAARRYFEFYRQALARKWKRMEVASETAVTLTGTGDDGRFVLHRDGRTVTAMEGLAPE
jgi:hypothetical protein